MKLISILFLFVTLNTFGQKQLRPTNKADITWAEQTKMKRGSNYDEVLFADSKNIFLSKLIKYDLYIEHRTIDLKVVTDQKIDLEHNGNQLRNEGLFSFGENFILLGRHSDKKAKVNSLFYKVISKSNLSNQTQWENISNITYENKRRTGSFDYTMSADSTMLLIYFSKTHKSKDAPEKFGFKVFNSNMELQWNKDIELKYNEDLFSVKTFRVDNEGNVYVLGRELKDTGSEKKRDKYDALFHILQYTESGDYHDFEVSLDDRPIVDITIAINQIGDIICAGFYSENTDYGQGIKGTFYHVIDNKTHKVKTTNFKELDEEFITEGWSDREIAKAKKKESKKGKSIEAYSYDLKDLVVNSDGGSTLLAEQYYVRVTTSTRTDANGVTTTTTTYHYYYNDIFIINIAPDGNISWASKIDKYQHSVNDHGYRSSYTLHVSDNLYLIYNMRAKDHYEREVYKAMSKQERKSYLTIIATVDSKGEVTKELLINNSEEEVYVVPKLCDQFSSDKTFIYTNRGKKVTLGILEFK